jgi:1,4-dihydroxy-2-naphthoate octaprenyltransferase
MPGSSGRLPSLTPARTLLGAFARTCRFDAALATVTPVLATTATAWWMAGRIDAPVAAFALAAAFTAGLGIHLAAEGTDRSMAAAPHVQAALRHAGGELPSRGAQLLNGQILSLGWLSLAISFVCSLWLGLLVGWPMLVFGAATLLLGITYGARPVRYGARGFGLGESGLFLALGLIPAIGAYYAQTSTVDALALWSALPFALLVSMMGVSFNLLNVRRDWLIRKRTLAVALGFGRAIDLSTVLLIGAFVTILFTAVVTDLPLRTIVALLALPIATSAYTQLDREQLPPVHGMRLYTAAIRCTLVTGLLYTLALITDRLW